MTVLEVTIALPWNEPAVGAVSSNTLHVDIANLTPATAGDDVLEVIAAAYNDYAHFGSILSGVLRLTAFDTEDPRPRPPVAVLDATFTPAGGCAPAPCAIMAQFESAVPANGDRSRGKSRVRLGPIANTALDGDGRWDPAVCDDTFTLFETISVDLQAINCVVVTGSEQHGFNPVASLRVSNRTALISKRLLPATYVATA